MSLRHYNICECNVVVNALHERNIIQTTIVFDIRFEMSNTQA